MKNHLHKLWSENKGTILFLALMFVFRSSLADWNHVPSGSMKPGMIEGDRIWINKIAYDLHLPFSTVKVTNFSDPKRGDIIIFNSRVSGNRLVKRVIGMPGDVVSMQDNVLKINGQTLDYETISDSEASLDLMEDLFGTRYQIRLSKRHANASSFAPVEVPRGSYLALGDNRDNSADSRFIGFIPRDEIIGRSSSVVMSLDRDDFYLPRKDRFFKAL